MNRTDIEIKLNKDRAWLLDTFALLPEADLTRAATKSEHDPSATWSAKDHLAHLAGIEKNFVSMVRRHLAGDPNPVALRTNPDGTDRSMEQIMATVHEMTERWVAEHRAKSLSEVVALGEGARAETLALLAELTDAQLAEKLPGAPWSDGTIGGRPERQRRPRPYALAVGEGRPRHGQLGFAPCEIRSAVNLARDFVNLVT